MIKPVKIHVPIFGRNIYFFHMKKELYNDYTKKRYPDTECAVIVGADAMCAFFVDEKKDKEMMLLYIDPKAKNLDGVVVHESVHIAQQILETLGCPHGNDNTEGVAYLTEYIFNKVMKEIAKKED